MICIFLRVIKTWKKGKNNNTLSYLKRLKQNYSINLNGDNLFKKSLIMFNGIIFNTGTVKDIKKNSICVGIQTN